MQRWAGVRVGPTRLLLRQRRLHAHWTQPFHLLPGPILEHATLQSSPAAFPCLRCPAPQVITATHEALAELPECGEVEVRLGHRTLFDLALLFVGVSRELRGSVIQLLATASVASPLHATARSKRWPSIKAGLEGIGLSAEAIARCRQLVLQVRGPAGWGG